MRLSFGYFLYVYIYFTKIEIMLYFSVDSFLTWQWSWRVFHVTQYLPTTSFGYLPIMIIMAILWWWGLWLISFNHSSAFRTMMSKRMFSSSQNIREFNAPSGNISLISYFADGKVEPQNVKWMDRSDGQKAAEPELKPSAWTPSPVFFQYNIWNPSQPNICEVDV